MSKRKPLIRLALLGVTTGLSLLLASHFLITFLYLSPVNPLKLAMWDGIHQYAADLFAQNWSFFAPTPIHFDSGLLVKCRLAGGAESEWLSMSQGMIDGLHSQPLGPYGRLARMHLTAIRFYHGGLNVEREQLRQVACDKDPKSSLCRREDPETRRVREMGRTMVQGLGSAACAQYAARAGEPAEAVKLRLLQASVRPLSRRHDPSWQPEVSGTETGWLPYREVAAMPLRLLPAGER